MTEQPKHPLDQAVSALQALPQAVQEAIAAEILARIDELGRSHLTPAQRAEVEARLSQPAEYAGATKVQEFFARHGARE